MKNTRLDEVQARIKFAGRNINNFRYADDTTLMVKREEEVKGLLIQLKEECERVKNSTFKQNKTKTWHSVPSLHNK